MDKHDKELLVAYLHAGHMMATNAAIELGKEAKESREAFEKNDAPKAIAAPLSIIALSTELYSRCRELEAVLCGLGVIEGHVKDYVTYSAGDSKKCA